MHACDHLMLIMRFIIYKIYICIIQSCNDSVRAVFLRQSLHPQQAMNHRSCCLSGHFKSVLPSFVFEVCLSLTAVCISQPLLSKWPPFSVSKQLAPLASNGGHMSLCIFWWTLDLPQEGCLLWKTLLRLMQPDRHDLRSTLILLHRDSNFLKIHVNTTH